MRFKNYVLFVGIFFSLTFSGLSYSGDVKVPQYLLSTSPTGYDSETAKPIYKKEEIKSIQHLSTDPSVLVFTQAGTPESIKINFRDLDFAIYFKKLFESFDSSHNFTFGLTESVDGSLVPLFPSSLNIRNEAGQDVDIVYPFLKSKFEKIFKEQVLPKIDARGTLYSLKESDKWLGLLKTNSWVNDIEVEGVYESTVRLHFLIQVISPSSWLFQDRQDLQASQLRVLADTVPVLVKEWRKNVAEKYALESQQKATERHEALVKAAKEKCNPSGGSSWSDPFSSSFSILNVFGLGSAAQQQSGSLLGRTRSLDTYQSVSSPSLDDEPLEFGLTLD